jgi:hypothetical protein
MHLDLLTTEVLESVYISAEARNSELIEARDKLIKLRKDEKENHREEGESTILLNIFLTNAILFELEKRSGIIDVVLELIKKDFFKIDYFKLFEHIFRTNEIKVLRRVIYYIPGAFKYFQDNYYVICVLTITEDNDLDFIHRVINFIEKQVDGSHELVKNSTINDLLTRKEAAVLYEARKNSKQPSLVAATIPHKIPAARLLTYINTNYTSEYREDINPQPELNPPKLRSPSPRR